MLVVICLDNNSIPTVSRFEDEIEALEEIKRLAENGARKITLAKEIPFEIERKVSVKLA